MIYYLSKIQQTQEGNSTITYEFLQLKSLLINQIKIGKLIPNINYNSDPNIESEITTPIITWGQMSKEVPHIHV